MTTIGKVAYVATWDATQLTKGIMSSRQQFAAQKKILEQSQTPLQRYENGLANLRTMVSRFPALLKEQGRLQADLNRDYLQAESAVRRLTAAEKKRLDLLNVNSSQSAMAMGSGGKTAAQIKAEVDAANRQRGLADQQRIHRYSSIVDQEAAIARRGLQERLKVFKAEKAARDKRLSEEIEAYRRERQFNLSRANAYAASVKRANSKESSGRLMAAGGLTAGLGGGLGFIAGAGAAYGLKNVVSEAIRVHAEVERSTAAFEVFTGSIGAADGLMRSLRNEASRTGVSFNAMQNAAATMMSFGVAASNTVSVLDQIANITRGDQERFKSLSLAYAQTQAAGKLMGQELLQMVNAGFNPLIVISEKTGQSIATLRKRMEAGELSSEMIAKAFKIVTGEGGKYNGMVEKMADTTAGSINRMVSKWEIFKDALGEALAPLTKATAGGFEGGLGKAAAALTYNFDKARGATMMKENLEKIDVSNPVKARAEWKRLGLEEDFGKVIAESQKLDSVLANSAASKKFREFDASLVREKEAMAKMAVEQKRMAEMQQPTEVGQSRLLHLREELGLISKQTLMRRELKNSGVRQWEIERIMLLERQLNIQSKQKEVMEQQRDRARDHMEQMRDRAADIRSQFGEMSGGGLTKQLAELEVLRRRGMIGFELFNTAATGATKQSLGVGQEQPRDVQSGIKAGSQEAYAFFRDAQKERSKEDKERFVVQQRLMQEANKLAELSLRQLEELSDLMPEFSSDG